MLKGNRSRSMMLFGGESLIGAGPAGARQLRGIITSIATLHELMPGLRDFGTQANANKKAQWTWALMTKTSLQTELEQFLTDYNFATGHHYLGVIRRVHEDHPGVYINCIVSRNIHISKSSMSWKENDRGEIDPQL